MIPKGKNEQCPKKPPSSTGIAAMVVLSINVGLMIVYAHVRGSSTITLRGSSPHITDHLPPPREYYGNVVDGGEGGKYDLRDFDERALRLYMHERRLALINESTVVNYQRIYHHFVDDMMMTIKAAPWGGYCPYRNSSTRDEFLRIFTDPHGGDILSGERMYTFCCAMRGFLETGGIKRHVLMHPFNSNWGDFSDHVQGRTTNWGYHEDCREVGDNDDGEARRYWEYLNHTNLSAVFTVQHQWLDHPKVHSVPLGPSGYAAGAAAALHAHPAVSDRVNPLLISNSDYKHRVAITQRIISNFNGTVANRYNDGSDYYELLRTSKFVLCPSGLGWDSHRVWEGLVLGTIPILETYYRKDGLYRTYANLPVLWVDHFDNITPELLAREYPRILSGAREYAFEKLTNRWWINLINSYRVRPVH